MRDPDPAASRAGREVRAQRARVRSFSGPAPETPVAPGSGPPWPGSMSTIGRPGASASVTGHRRPRRAGATVKAALTRLAGDGRRSSIAEPPGRRQHRTAAPRQATASPQPANLLAFEPLASCFPSTQCPAILTGDLLTRHYPNEHEEERPRRLRRGDAVLPTRPFRRLPGGAAAAANDAAIKVDAA